MGDFSDKSSAAKRFRIPINILLEYVEEARAAAARRPPKRFRTPKSERGLKFDERSLSTTRVRQRLCDLMGTDVIRLNDKRYFQTLSMRLQEEYDGIMDKQEDSRAAQENERLRRLMLEGIIEDPNDYRAIVHGEHAAKKKKTKKRKIKRRIRISDGPSRPESGHTQSEMTSHTADDEHASMSSKEDVRTQVEILSDTQDIKEGSKSPEPQETKTTSSSSLQKACANKGNDKLAQPIREMHARPPHHENAMRSSPSSSSRRKPRRIKSAAPRLSGEKDYQSDDSNEDVDEAKYDTMSLPDYNRKNSKYSKNEPEQIRRLRMEQTVAGLYSIAEELVSPVKTEALLDRKV